MEKLSYREQRSRIYRYSVQINQRYKDLIYETMYSAALRLNLDAGKVKFSHNDIMCELFHADEPMYLTEIAKRVGVKLPNVSRLVNELIEIGLVERCVHPQNKRVVLVTLTEIGREFSHIVIPGIIEVNSITFGSDDETETVYEYYQKIHDRLFKEESL